MAAWITIYLQGDLPKLTPDTIRAGISPADWSTLGEQVDLEEDEVKAFMAALVWSDAPLEIRAAGRRPIQVHVWTDPARIREDITELDQIAGQEVPDAVRARLKSIRAIVALELAFTQLDTMFEILCFEIAYWLAEVGNGVIKVESGRWFDHAKHRWKPFE